MDARLERLSLLHTAVGAVGAVIADMAARLQPGRMVVVDPKPIAATSPSTGLAFGSRAQGRNKARHVSRGAAAASPHTVVYAFEGPAQDLPMVAWLAADVVVLAADNLSAEVFVGEMCHRLGLPLIVANVHGASLVAQVRTFSNRGESAPCPACGFSREEWRLSEQEVHFSCDGSEPAWAGSQAPPTRSTAHLCTLAAGLAVNQLLRLVLGVGQPVGDTLLEYCGLSNRQSVSPLPCRPECRCDHTPWERHTLQTDPSAMTVDALGTGAGLDAGAPGFWITVDGKEYVDRGFCSCSQKGEGRPIHRFLSAGHRCPACGKALSVPFHRHARVTARLLGARRAWSLRRLGVRPGDVVLLGDTDSGRTVVIEPSAPASPSVPGPDPTSTPT